MGEDYNVDKLDGATLTKFVFERDLWSSFKFYVNILSDIRIRGVVSCNLYYIYLSVSPYTTRAPQRGVLLTRSMARSRVSRAFRTMESPI